MTIPSDLLAFLATLLRGAQLSAQALLIGGTAFLLAVARPLRRQLPHDALAALTATAAKWTARAGLLLATIALLSAAMSIYDLGANLDVPFTSAIGAEFVLWAGAVVAGGLAAWLFGRTRLGLAVLTASALLVLAASVMSSHAAARLDRRAFFMVADLLHQGGAGVWIGGIPFLLLGLRRLADRKDRFVLGSRCSQLYMGAIGALATGALMMAIGYTGSWTALIGTAYGAMMGAKGLLLAALLLFGLANMLSVRRIAAGGDARLLHLRRFAEAEIGIGITVMFVAASLATQPPAIDQMTDPASIASLHDIAGRLAPTWPRLSSPTAAEIAIPTDIGASAPTSEADQEWSEFNHHWAGILVLAMGMLALIHRSGRADWARHWPLLFIGLGAMLFIRSDPESWPLGPIPFWARFADPEVFQHRLVVFLVIAFGLFEWAVRTRRLDAGWTRLAFPMLCAVGGALLMTHSHSLTDLKQRYMVEISHLPMGVLGVFAGWSRWLELRGDARIARAAGWVWPLCFVLIGLLLIDYREP